MHPTKLHDWHRAERKKNGTTPDINSARVFIYTAPSLKNRLEGESSEVERRRRGISRSTGAD